MHPRHHWLGQNWTRRECDDGLYCTWEREINYFLWYIWKHISYERDGWVWIYITLWITWIRCNKAASFLLLFTCFWNKIGWRMKRNNNTFKFCRLWSSIMSNLHFPLSMLQCHLFSPQASNTPWWISDQIWRVTQWCLSRTTRTFFKALWFF